MLLFHQHGTLFNTALYLVALFIVVRTIYLYLIASESERKKQKSRLIQLLCIGILYTYMFYNKMFSLGDLLDVSLFVLAP